MKTTPTAKTTTWVFTIFLLTSILLSAISPPCLQLVGLFLCIAVLVIVIMARATMVAWITVLVLLAFAGKRRRVLVQEGRKITADVAGHLVKVLWPGGRGICNCC